MDERRFDVGIIGSGSAASALVRKLDGSGMSVVVFEDRLVGGECPFYACMPSKALLHDSRTEAGWPDAAARRDEIVHELDDSSHAEGLLETGVTLVRSRAEITGPGLIDAGGTRFAIGHTVLATGSEPIVPDGAEALGELCWTSDDALVSDDRPQRLTIVGGGVVGTECAFLFAGFGTTVTLVNHSDQVLDEAPPAVNAVLEARLEDLGVELRPRAEATSFERRGDDAVTVLDDGSTVVGDRVLVSIGRRPSTRNIGLEELGLDPDEPLPVDDCGRVRCDGRLWAIGDVAGHDQYTHLANHHALVVADHLAGSATRRFDDVVVPACMFTDPPFLQVGPSYAELVDDDDVVAAGNDLESVPRTSTDQLGDGYLWVAARRSTGCVVAAAGIGPRFDEIVHALVVAVDGAVPVARLRLSMQPFPTVGEIMGPIFDDLHRQLTA